MKIDFWDDTVTDRRPRAALPARSPRGLGFAARAAQTMHDVQSERTADGVAVVERGSGLLARLVAFVIGLPPAGTDIPITVSFRARQGREYWQRNFAGQAFSSVQEQGRGRCARLLCERFSPWHWYARANACGS